ncbi:uncharacterized protein LOC142349993 [Convolutriloba macropyga]|uniref:uncharacterized protein LOC142349993 n=1 Tax=Convolutriloba macropyga TaxID=536237 RepID=UPI003F51F70D
MTQPPVPTFYPTASRVTVGPTKDELKTVEETMEMLKKVPKFVDLFEGRHKIRDEYIKQACIDMSFDFDVVKTRGKEAITFDLAKKIVLEELYRTNQIPGVKEKRGPAKTEPGTEQGRMYSVEPNVKTHVNCHALKSNQKYEARKQQKVHFLETVEEERAKVSLAESSLKRHTSRTEKVPSGTRKDITTQSKIFKEVEQKKKTLIWDEYILTRVSKNTARWIVSNHVPSPSQKEHLKQFLEEKKIGFKEQEDLVVDGESETSEQNKQAEYLGKLRRSPTKLSGEPINENLSKKFKSLYFKQNFAEENEDVKKVVAMTENRSAMIERPSSQIDASILEKRAKAVKQSMSHNKSDSKFVNEIIGGAKSVFLTENAEELHLDTGNIYTVRKTKIFPEKDSSEIGRFQGKSQRWKEIPRIKTDHRKMKAADNSAVEAIDLDKQLVELDSEGLHRKMIVQRWLKLHKIGSLWHNSQVADIFDKLKSLDSRIRLEALGVCAQATVFRLEKLSDRLAGPNGDDFVIANEDQGFLPDSILELVQAGLDDESHYVRFGAALTLMIQDKCSEKCQQIISDVIEKVSSTFEEKFIAALALTYSGYVDSKIANVFIDCLLQTAEKSEMDLCILSLSKLSDSTRVIHCLIGEQLNSTSWKYRFLACKVLPSLRGPPNKDITRKLVHIMWHDIEPNVRSVAAVALGKLGLGNHVHSKLLNLYKKTDRETILDVVERTGQLGIMTEKLLPHFLKCFKHDYISVRVAACNTASSLMLKDRRILDTLEESAQFDPSDKVKSAAIDALAHIGQSNAQLASIILWCIRWANDLNVVISAARAIIKLNLRNSETTNVIQERLLSLQDQATIDELKTAMEWLGDDPSGDLEMIRTLKEEIRKQSTKENIIRLINDLEQDDQYQICIDKMLTKENEKDKPIRFEGQGSPHDLGANQMMDALEVKHESSPNPSLNVTNESIIQGENEIEPENEDDVTEEESDIDNMNKSVASQSEYESDLDNVDDVIDDADNDEIKPEDINRSSNGSQKMSSPRSGSEKRELLRSVQNEQQPSRNSESSKGPPKPDFFRSLALSRASNNKEDL